MDEIGVSQLPDELRGLAQKARQAAGQGDDKLVVHLCQQVLAKAPACLKVRELHFTSARRLQGRRRFDWRARVRGFFGNAGGQTMIKSATLQQADLAIAKDFFGVRGWYALAEAAAAEGCAETELFARRSLVQLHPSDRRGVIRLAELLVKRGQATDALEIVKAGLKTHRGDADLEALQQRAAVAQTMSDGKWSVEGDSRT